MTAETHVRATRYEVTAVPADVRDHIDACFFALRVEERGADKWAVTDGVRCLNKSGGWSEEPIPSSRPFQARLPARPEHCDHVGAQGRVETAGQRNDRRRLCRACPQAARIGGVMTAETKRTEGMGVCDCAGRCAFCNEYGCATCPEWSAPWFVKLWRRIMGAPHV